MHARRNIVILTGRAEIIRDDAQDVLIWRGYQLVASLLGLLYDYRITVDNSLNRNLLINIASFIF